MSTEQQDSGNEGSSAVVIDETAKRGALTPSASEIAALLAVMEKDILPATNEGVQAGNKVFGAAIVNSKFECVLAGTNAETECPLFHGEVKVIYEWSKVTPAAERGPAAQSSIFLATHEPCCMCISSILWSGFTQVYYFFPYSATTAQGIPHDINTMHELWAVPTYRKRNKYLSTACLLDLIQGLPDDNEQKKELQATAQRLTDAYDQLSNKYHSEKAANPQNSLVLN